MLKLISLNQVCKIAHISNKTIRHYIRTGNFIDPVAYMVENGVHLYDEVKVREWIENDYPLVKELIKKEGVKKQKASKSNKEINIIDSIINDLEK